MKETLSALFRRFLYFFLILVIAVGVVYIYFLWWERRESLNPEVVSAVPYTHSDRIPARAVLLWREEVVSSRWSGAVAFPAPGPRRVAKGETLAVVSAPSGKMAVKAEKTGYFVPALDGAEGEWTYAAFWNGMAPLPSAPPAQFIGPGTFVEKGRPVGKLISQPQDLRCILYADVTPSLERDIRAGFVRVKTKETEWAAKAEVRVARFLDSKVKLYLTLPFFPASATASREMGLLLEAGERSGVSVPESAVLFREGRLGVLLVDGNMVHFQAVRGIPVEGGRFFITEGLRPGNIVVLHAQNGKEGKIRLW
ncbi:hypothetical protein C8D99_101352 [Aminivibrio pyruvatiphilus]|uniref:HlyD family secretion protein n=1 Tax=Aminivibrio pyruvatiphilus TaxID=1005740 RepID=A0A4V3HHH0_9BACT|nr:hypothetical protein [Aminivibrio pyruvatiphilus]TDY65201.1 hypothetical protein C8D99_101352 [Aminivibrio pyruvatiphilus]